MKIFFLEIEVKRFMHPLNNKIVKLYTSFTSNYVEVKLHDMAEKMYVEIFD